MTEIERTGSAVWIGDLRNGSGRMGLESSVLTDQAYSFATRFKDAPGTNPEELIAAAHAGCYSMALANVISKKGYQVNGIETTVTIHLTSKEGGGFAITKSGLRVRGRVSDIDEERFEQLAEEADGSCPVSNLLRPGLEIELEAELA
ncbi:MAG: OsmC family protein [Anaerolineae bacterium]